MNLHQPNQLPWNSDVSSTTPNKLSFSVTAIAKQWIYFTLYEMLNSHRKWEKEAKNYYSSFCNFFFYLFFFKINRRISPLRAWLCAHAKTSLEKFEALEECNFQNPMMFQGEIPMTKFPAYIDRDNKFKIEDKLSQVNTLQQLQNITSYGFLRKRFLQYDLHIHALWFDI